MTNYDKIFEDWENLPNCRIDLDLGEGGESLWGKVLPDGLYAINNSPLYAEFRWQDVVRTTKIRSVDDLVWRRWGTKVWFSWPEPEGEEGAEFRKRVMEKALSEGHYPGFFCRGAAFVMFREVLDEEAARKKVSEILSVVGLEPSFKEKSA